MIQRGLCRNTIKKHFGRIRQMFRSAVENEIVGQERVDLQSVVKKLKGTGQKVRRAQTILKADAEGPHWTDERIVEAYGVGREQFQ